MRPAPVAAGVRYCDLGWADRPTDVGSPLEGAVTCDVAVVGGGYAGMSTAVRLAEPGADVVLLAAGFCGSGASSCNAGQLVSVPGGDPILLNQLHPRRFPGMIRLAASAVGFTEKLIAREAIDCDYEATGNVAAATTPRPAETRREEGRDLRQGRRRCPLR